MSIPELVIGKSGLLIEPSSNALIEILPILNVILIPDEKYAALEFKNYEWRMFTIHISKI